MKSLVILWPILVLYSAFFWSFDISELIEHRDYATVRKNGSFSLWKVFWLLYWTVIKTAFRLSTELTNIFQNFLNNSAIFIIIDINPIRLNSYTKH